MSNQKADDFNQFIESHDHGAFAVQEREHDEQHGVLFHSRMVVNHKEYPFIIKVDDSVFVSIRLLLDRTAITEEKRNQVLEEMNRLNTAFTAFKHYIDRGGSMVLEACLIMPEAMDGNMIYNMLALMEQHLKYTGSEIEKAAGIAAKPKGPDLNFVK
jgi:hypothetical protein